MATFALTSGEVARADDGNVVATSGSAATSGGTARVLNVDDLKCRDGSPLFNTPSQNDPWNIPAPAECVLDPEDYDDDPAGNPGDAQFHVTPNLHDVPLQWAHKKIFVDVAASDDVNAVQASLLLGNAVVWDVIIPGTAGVKGPGCGAHLGNVGIAGTVGDGIVKTGQKTATEFQELRNRCEQGEVKVYNVLFPISKHLPPGEYRQCVVLSYAPSGSSEPFCDIVHVREIVGWQMDFSAVSYGDQLRQNLPTVVSGDWLFNGPNDPKPTVMGTGNVTRQLMTQWSDMKLVTPLGTKWITGYFDVQLNRRDAAGDIVETEHYDQILGGGDPDSADPFVEAQAATFVNICLEPNQPLKMDFSLTPIEPLFSDPNSGYRGKIRLSLNSVECAPATLGPGEWAGGDTDSVDNNVA
jgi:hypothetical protein